MQQLQRQLNSASDSRSLSAISLYVTVCAHVRGTVRERAKLKQLKRSYFNFIQVLRTYTPLRCAYTRINVKPPPNRPPLRILCAQQCTRNKHSNVNRVARTSPERLVLCVFVLDCKRIYCANRKHLWQYMAVISMRARRARPSVWLEIGAEGTDRGRGGECLGAQNNSSNCTDKRVHCAQHGQKYAREFMPAAIKTLTTRRCWCPLNACVFGRGRPGALTYHTHTNTHTNNSVR